MKSSAAALFALAVVSSSAIWAAAWCYVSDGPCRLQRAAVEAQILYQEVQRARPPVPRRAAK